jgi:hypothetical protein
MFVHERRFDPFTSSNSMIASDSERGPVAFGETTELFPVTLSRQSHAQLESPGRDNLGQVIANVGQDGILRGGC